MRHFPKLTACFVGAVSALATVFLGITIASAIGHFTNSSLVGICGPYGPHAGLMVLIFLGSLIASPIAGVYIAWRVLCRLTRNESDPVPPKILKKDGTPVV